MAVRVLIDGLGDVAPNVVWSQVDLNTAAQGEASMSQLILRDFDVDPYAFQTGRKVIVDLGSDETRIFGGYLWKAARRFWFPVDEPNTLHRQWRLQLVDNNILFARRVVFKKSDPAHVTGPLYGPQKLCDETAGIVYDDTAIAELVANWLDLSIDGIDVSTLVQQVASITYGQQVYPWNGGMTWGEAMTTIAQLPAAIFYLDPWWRLVYADVDEATAPFGLSDHPDKGSSFMEITWQDHSVLEWQPDTIYDGSSWDTWAVRPTGGTTVWFRAGTSGEGRSGATEPEWVGTQVIDNEITWIGVDPWTAGMNVSGVSVVPTSQNGHLYESLSSDDGGVILNSDSEPVWPTDGGTVQEQGLIPLGDAGTNGYRECTILDNGSQLANEAFGWGFGKGVDHPVFKHDLDQGSIDEHGLWQDGITLYSVWCQPTIDKAVQSDLFGSPSSKRGHKDSVMTVELVTRENGLRPGQVVRFINHEYGEDIDLPIRSMKLTFDAPDQPKYALKLGHVLDKWGFQDPSPPFRITPNPCPVPPCSGQPPPGTECTDEVCIDPDTGINRCLDFRSIDNFNRAVPSGWGTSSSHLTWSGSGSLAAVIDGISHLSGVGAQVQYLDGLPCASSGWVEFLIRFRPDRIDTGLDGRAEITFKVGAEFSDDGASWITFSSDASEDQYLLPNTDGALSPWYMLRWRLDQESGVSQFHRWEDGQAEPTEWYDASTVNTPTFGTFIVDVYHGGAGLQDTQIDYIDAGYDGRPCYQVCSGGSVGGGLDYSTLSGWNVSELTFRNGPADFPGSDPPVPVLPVNGYSIAKGYGSLQGSLSAYRSNRSIYDAPIEPFQYVESRSIITYIVPDGTVSVRIRGRMQAFVAIGTEVPGFSTWALTSLSVTEWDDGNEDPVTPGGWEPNGSLIASPSVEILTTDDPYYSAPFDVTIPVSGNKFQLHVSNRNESVRAVMLISTGPEQWEIFDWDFIKREFDLDELKSITGLEPFAGNWISEANVTVGVVDLTVEALGYDVVIPPDCVEVEAVSPPTSGYYCETIFSTDNPMLLSRPYVPGSTVVTIDGIFQAPGTYDQVTQGVRAYHEVSPAEGSLLFGLTPDGGGIRVCYQIGAGE